MVLEGKTSFKEALGDTFGFIQRATAEELLAVAAGTALRSHPLVQNFNNPAAQAFFQKTEELRRLIAREWKRHADFRGMVIRKVMTMQPEKKGNENPEKKKGK